MKLGVFAVLFGNKPFEETLDYLVELGLEAVEIGTGAYPGDAHCKPRELLTNDSKLKAFKRGHRSARPRDQRAELPRQSAPSGRQDREGAPRDRSWSTVALAKKLDVEHGDHVQRLSGRRSDGDAAQLDRLAVAARVRRRCSSGSGRSACCRTGRTTAQRAASGRRARRHRDAPELRRLQPGDDAAAVGDRAGRHRLQLRSEPHVLAAGSIRSTAIRALGDRIYHVHAKDCRIDRGEHGAERRARRARTTRASCERSWIFRTVGYGNDALVWKDIVSNLRLVGYDHVHQHRARGQRDVGRRGPEEGHRVPEGRRDQRAGRTGVLGVETRNQEPGTRNQEDQGCP